jgi:hypothetical protein
VRISWVIDVFYIIIEFALNFARQRAEVNRSYFMDLLFLIYLTSKWVFSLAMHCVLFRSGSALV